MGDFISLWETLEQQELDSLRQEIKSREQTEQEEQGGFSKAIGMLGTLYNVPINVVYNARASKYRLPSKPLLSSTTDVSDIVELENPKLLYNKDWQKRKVLLDIGASIFGDISTYGSFGLTKLGRAASLLDDVGIVGKLDDAGKMVFQVEKYSPEVGEAIGTKLDDILNASRATGKVPKQISELDSLLKELEKSGELGRLAKVPKTMRRSEQIRQGYRGYELFGTQVLPKTQADFVEKTERIIDSISKSNSPIARGLKKVFQGKPTKQLGIVTGNTDLSELLRRVEDPPLTEAYNAMRRAELDVNDLRGAIRNIRESTWAREGYGSLEEYMNSLGKLDDLGLTADESRKLLSIYQHYDKIDEIKKTGSIMGDYFDIKTGKVLRGEVTKIPQKFLDDFNYVIDDLIVKMSDANISRTKLLKEFADDTGLRISLEKHYAKAIPLSITDLSKTKKLLNNRDKLRKAIEAAQGYSRTYRGNSIESIEMMRSVLQKNIEKSPGYGISGASILLRDERWIGDNTVGDIIEFGKKIKDKDISDALKAGQKEYADMMRSAKDMSEMLDTIKVKAKWTDDEISKIKKVNIGEMFSKAKDDAIVDWYYKGIPQIEAISKIEVDKRIRAFNFLNELFRDGIKNDYVKLVEHTTDGVKKARSAGFKVLDKYNFLHVIPERAAQILGDSFDPTVRYIYALRDDVFDVLSQTKLMKGIDNPYTIMGGLDRSNVIKTIDKINKLWKETTLLPFPSYYFRNFIDDITKTTIEGVGWEDRSQASRLLRNKAKDTKMPIFEQLGPAKEKIKIKTAFGRTIDEDELWKIILENNVIGKGVRDLGLVGDDPIRHSIELMKKEGLIHNNNLILAQKVNESLPVNSKYRNIMNSLVGIQSQSEAWFRVSTFINRIKKTSINNALQDVNRIHLDYGDLNQFEKQVMNRLFAFYGFTKGIMKYLGYKVLHEPMQMKIIANIPELAESTFVSPDERFNKTLLPEWLKESSIQVGMTDEGMPTVVNLKGLTSFAELANFINPFKILKQSLLPTYKIPIEYIKGESEFFGRPHELYPGEKGNVAGIPIRRGRIAYQAYKSLRLPQAIERSTEALLRKTPISIFGTAEKKSYFGLGSLGEMHPDKVKTILMKYGMGVPVTEVDVNRAIRDKSYQLRNDLYDYKRGIRGIQRKYGNRDPEYARKEAKRRTDKYLKTIKKYSASSRLFPELVKEQRNELGELL